jgi:hypothetical protein
LYSSFRGHAPCARALIEGGADCSHKSKDGIAAIDYAISMGKTEIWFLISQRRDEQESQVYLSFEKWDELD